MESFISGIKKLIFFCFFLGLCALAVIYYPWLFGKTVDGEIIEVERVTSSDAVLGKVDKFQMHSFAVLIQDKDGEMYTSSSEDRRWDVAKKGMCVISLFYRHPPWQLQSGNGFFNARVQKIYRCPGKQYPDSSQSNDAETAVQSAISNTPESYDQTPQNAKTKSNTEVPSTTPAK